MPEVPVGTTTVRHPLRLEFIDEDVFEDDDRPDEDFDIDWDPEPIQAPGRWFASPVVPAPQVSYQDVVAAANRVRFNDNDNSRISFTTAGQPVWTLAIREEVAPLPEARTTITTEALPLEVLHLTPDRLGYGQHIRGAFQFFRRNAQNRYSASTLMRLANAAGEFDDRTLQGTEPAPRTSSLLPVITVASRPLSYDEDTEIKNGGTVGMMVTWPDGKALFAVVSGSRRQGIGRRIFEYNSRYSRLTPFFWVNTANVPAQQFLLAMGLTPTGLNGNGAVRYGYSGGEE